MSLTIEEVPFGGWAKNLRLANESVELIVTLDVGPRILRFAPLGGRNVFAEFPGMLGGIGESEWMIRGGHRLWTAPEGPHSYAPDNVPVSYSRPDDTSVEIESANEEYGFTKTLNIELQPSTKHSSGTKLGGRVKVTHTLTNSGGKPLDITPWSLSVMAPGGVAIVPQPAFKFHPTEDPALKPVDPAAPKPAVNYDDFLPNRNLVLWPFTVLNDPRFTLGRDFWVVRQQVGAPATKFGILHQEDWVSYQLGDVVFSKKVPYVPGAAYPDGGVNFELFSNTEILELECLAPLGTLQPGDSRTLVELWRLDAAPGDMAQPEVAAAYYKAITD
ncbi:MAG: hypothetical protein ACAI35_08490 [Candidatus Methylacidiphilales bacterium]|nr:hypothetical protein [Candidatus Methylacidiphilales bacterium]